MIGYEISGVSGWLEGKMENCNFYTTEPCWSENWLDVVRVCDMAWQFHGALCAYFLGPIETTVNWHNWWAVED